MSNEGAFIIIYISIQFFSFSFQFFFVASSVSSLFSLSNFCCCCSFFHDHRQAKRVARWYDVWFTDTVTNTFLVTPSLLWFHTLYTIISQQYIIISISGCVFYIFLLFILLSLRYDYDLSPICHPFHTFCNHRTGYQFRSMPFTVISLFFLLLLSYPYVRYVCVCVCERGFVCWIFVFVNRKCFVENENSLI